MFTRCSIVALLAVCGQAVGQSFNVDLNTASGSGAGVPPSTYAGVMGQPGVWNAVTPGSSGTVTLNGLTGTASGVTLTRSGNGSSATASIAGATTDYARMLWDYSMGFTQSGNNQVTFNGLAPGLYRVAVYAYLPGAEGQYESGGFTNNHTNNLSLNLGGVNAGNGTTSGAATVNTFEEGITHRFFTLNVGAGAPALQIRSYCDLGNGLGKAALNAIQVVKYDTNRLYVDKDATTGLKTGKTWTDAFTDLQDALRLARESGGLITEIWVADGVYKPTTTTNRTRTFSMVNGCAVYGGFVGTETALNQRTGAATYLSGDIGITRNTTDNSYNVVTATSVTSSAVLDGFIVTGGNASGSGVNGVGDNGGGMIITSASPTVRNCSIQNNSASVFGGGVYVLEGSPRFSNCVFASNDCDWQGGGLRFYSAASGIGAPFIDMVNCRFVDNTAVEAGAAIQSNGGDLWLANCVMHNNSTNGRGGAIAASGTECQVRMYQCTVTGNTSGAILSTLLAEYSASFDVRNSIVWGNGAWSVTTQFGGSFTASYSLLNGNAILPGSGNVTANPMFANVAGTDGFIGTSDDDFSLLATSPAVDAASVANIPSDWLDIDADGLSFGESLPIDFAGNARRIDVLSKSDTGVGFAPLPDMGAFEAPDVTPCPADWDADGDVDSDDIIAFFSAWENGEGDFDIDSDSDSDDVIGFFASWDSGC